MAIGLGLALSGIGALGKAATGLFQGAKANRIDRNNIRPIQEVQQEYFRNANEAENMARVGLPQQQYLQGLQNQQRNFNGAVRSLGRSANSSAGLAGLLRASNDATMGLDIADANARQNNQRLAMQQRGILGQQKQNAFDWNKKSKYLAEAARAQALRGAGGQNLMGAFGDVQQIGAIVDQNENGNSGTPSFNSGQQSNVGFNPRAFGGFGAPRYIGG